MTKLGVVLTGIVLLGATLLVPEGARRAGFDIEGPGRSAPAPVPVWPPVLVPA